MAKPSGIDSASGERFYLRIHVTAGDQDDLDTWAKNITKATKGQVVPHHSFIDSDADINPGYTFERRNVDNRFHLRFMPAISAGKRYEELIVEASTDRGREALARRNIIVNDTADGPAFIVTHSYLESVNIFKQLKSQPWWNFGNEPHRVKPITSLVGTDDEDLEDYALYDPVFFGEGVGPVVISTEDWARISLQYYGITEADEDYPDAMRKAIPLLEAILLEDEDKIVTPRKRPSLEKKRTPVRFRAGFFTSLIPEYANLSDAQKAALTDEERRPWEFWVRDPEKYPEDQGRPYWDVLGLTRDPEESLDGLKYRQVRTAWQNQTPYGREKHRIWNQSQDNKEAQRLYDQSAKGREKKDAYKATEGGKQATALYQKRRAIRNKVYRTLFREINPITGNRWTEMEADYYVWDNYGEQLLRSSWIRGEKRFIEGPGVEPNLSMNEKYGIDHIRPERISPSDLDFDDGYSDPQEEEKEE